MFTPHDEEIETLDLVANPSAERLQPNADIQRLRERLEQVQRELWAAQAKMLEPGQVRFVGRVAEVKIGSSGTHSLIALVVPDEHQRHQVICLRAEVAVIANAWLGAEVTLIGAWRHGRLTVIDLEDMREVAEPIPEVPASDKPKAEGAVPDWFHSNPKNVARDLMKAADGSSSVSDLKVHIVFATKRRGKVLTGAMVERFKLLAAEVVAAKGLGKLLAANCEADHAHLALHLPVNVSASEVAGAIKVYTARLLRREYPELQAHDTESLWQRGFYAGAIGNGGDLRAVLHYIEHAQNMPVD